MIDLKGKVAVVTGGSRGIGAAVSLMLARAGADLAVAYQSHRVQADAVCAEIQALGRRAAAFQGDLSSHTDCERLFQQTTDQLGHVDILVANAGIWKRAPIDEMTCDQWHEMLRVNLDSIYNSCKQAALRMKPRNRGKIILIGSTAGVRGEAFHSHYAATKGAVMAFVKSLAAELGPFNINVNCVAPGWVLTDMTREVFADSTFRTAVEASIPLRRIASPEDIAGSVLFLASELARHIQGSTLHVNGGSVLV